MKRTYVDITAEYYDNDEILDTAQTLGIRDADLRKAFRVKRARKKQKIMSE